MDESKPHHHGHGIPLHKKYNGENFTEYFDLSKLFGGTQRHVLFIAISMLIFGVLATYLSYRIQNTYVAEAVLLFRDDGPSKEIEGGFTLANMSLPTVFDMIMMPKHFEAVKSTLGLELDPGKIQAMVDLPFTEGGSNLVSIVAKANNPHFAVDLANQLAKVSVKTSQEFVQKQLLKALEGYQKQLASAKRTLDSHITQMERFKLENQYFDMSPEDNTFLAKVEETWRMKNKADLDYNSLLVKYENLKKQIDSIPNFVPITMDSKDSPLQTRIMTLETALAEARAKYTPDNPRLIRLESELEGLLRRSKQDMTADPDGQFYEKNPLKETLEVELLHLQGQVSSAEKMKEDVTHLSDALEVQLSTFPIKQMALVKLLHSKNITEERLNTLSRAVEIVELMIDFPKGSIEVYQLAESAKPWKDALWVDLLPLFGLIFGFGLGIVGAMILEIRDPKIRTPKQVELSYNIPCIGSVPEIRKLSKKTADTQLLFFVRGVVDYLGKVLEARGIKSKFSLAVTSSLSKEGKTLFTTTLGNYYARMGKKVLVVYMDPKNLDTERKPASASFNRYLKGKTDLEAIISKGTPDSATLFEKEPQMKELLKTQAMARFWEYASSHYEIIIIDTPGVIEEAYALDLNRLADLNLFIVGSSQVNRSFVDEALEALDFAEARPCGILLNRVQPIYIKDKRILLEMKKKGLSLESLGYRKT